MDRIMRAALILWAVFINEIRLVGSAQADTHIA